MTRGVIAPPPVAPPWLWLRHAHAPFGGAFRSRPAGSSDRHVVVDGVVRIEHGVGRRRRIVLVRALLGAAPLPRRVLPETEPITWTNGVVRWVGFSSRGGGECEPRGPVRRELARRPVHPSHRAVPPSDGGRRRRFVFALVAECDGSRPWGPRRPAEGRRIRLHRRRRRRVSRRVSVRCVRLRRRRRRRRRRASPLPLGRRRGCFHPRLGGFGLLLR